MKRTQIYLGQPLWKRLTALSHERHITISELVREGLAWIYLRPSPTEAFKAIHGLWADRKNFSTDRYIRGLRQDRHRQKYYAH